MPDSAPGSAQTDPTRPLRQRQAAKIRRHDDIFCCSAIALVPPNTPELQAAITSPPTHRRSPSPRNMIRRRVLAVLRLLIGGWSEAMRTANCGRGASPASGTPVPEATTLGRVGVGFKEKLQSDRSRAKARNLATRVRGSAANSVVVPCRLQSRGSTRMRGGWRRRTSCSGATPCLAQAFDSRNHRPVSTGNFPIRSAHRHVPVQAHFGIGND